MVRNQVDFATKGIGIGRILPQNGSFSGLSVYYFDNGLDYDKTQQVFDG
jgi:hypothetical protein